MTRAGAGSGHRMSDHMPDRAGAQEMLERLVEHLRSLQVMDK